MFSLWRTALQVIEVVLYIVIGEEVHDLKKTKQLNWSFFNVISSYF